MTTTPTAEELDDIALCAQKLWDLDADRVESGVDYSIDPQGGTDREWDSDAAPGRLFLNVSDSLWERPAYRSFRFLLDNYIREEGITEVETQQEQREINSFVDEAMRSAPMQYVWNYVASKDLVSQDEGEFRQQLMALWFDFYRRESVDDSSGFEHVFIGETDDTRVGGFHNWIQFFLEESRGNVNYRGYVIREGEAPDANERLMQIQFAWGENRKIITSFLIGCSPQFELALYTLYFLNGEQNNRVNLLNYRVNIRCYRIHGNRISSTFCEIEDEFKT